MEIEQIKRDLEEARRFLAEEAVVEVFARRCDSTAARLTDIALRLAGATQWLLAERDAFSSRLQRTSKLTAAAAVSSESRAIIAEATQPAALTL